MKKEDAKKEMKKIEFTVFGQLHSMKNCRIIRCLPTASTKKKCRHYPISIKSAKANEYAVQFVKQTLGMENIPLKGKIRLTVHVFYQSWRSDLDVELLCDCLQKANIIENDRQIMEKYLYKDKDKENPRCEIKLEIL